MQFWEKSQNCEIKSCNYLFYVLFCGKKNYGKNRTGTYKLRMVSCKQEQILKVYIRVLMHIYTLETLEITKRFWINTGFCICCIAFMHLAFILNELHCIKYCLFMSSCIPWESNPWPWHCYCSTMVYYLSYRNAFIPLSARSARRINHPHQ